VKSTHAYYACRPICKTAAYDIGEPLPEDEDNNSYDIEERPEDQRLVEQPPKKGGDVMDFP
jgi:hypothetical protein